jgi:hypothetical protein
MIFNFSKKIYEWSIWLSTFNPTMNFINYVFIIMLSTENKYNEDKNDYIFAKEMLVLIFMQRWESTV